MEGASRSIESFSWPIGEKQQIMSSSQRVIQDSDDEDEDIRSDIASSCDPLQDPSYAPDTGTIARVVDQSRQPEVQIPLSAANLPQVDFDRFLRSESSIMAGDYEDERWAPTANSNTAQGKHESHLFPHKHSSN